MSPAQITELNDRLTLWTIKDIKCWLTAIEIAALLTWQLERAHGVRYSWSYRPVAFALRRLVRNGIIEERVVTYRGKSRSKEERREYRVKQAQEHPLFPTPKPIPPSAPRRVHRMEG